MSLFGSGGLFGKLDPIGRTITGKVADPLHLYHDAPTPPDASAMEAAKQRRLAALRDQINGLFSSPERQVAYRDYQKNVLAQTMDALNHQADAGRRNLTFNAARHGYTGGSADADARGEFNRNYQQQVLSAAQRARQAAHNLMAQDQATKNRLLTLANNGMDATDSARYGDLLNMQKVNNAQSYVMPQMADNLAGGFGAAYNNTQKQQGIQDALNKLMQSNGGH